MMWKKVRFYIVLIVVSGAVVVGGWYFNKYSKLHQYSMPADAPNAEEWNKTVKGKVEDLPVGTTLVVPDEIIAKIKVDSLRDAEAEDITMFPDGAITGQTDSQGNPFEHLYTKDFNFNQVFEGNLKPSDVSVFSGFQRVSVRNSGSGQNDFFRTKPYFPQFAYNYLEYPNMYKKSKGNNWLKLNEMLVSDRDRFGIFHGNSNPEEVPIALFYEMVKSQIPVYDNTNTIYLRSQIGMNHARVVHSGIFSEYLNNWTSMQFDNNKGKYNVNYGPSQYNMISESSKDHYWITYAPKKVTKIDDNLILVDIIVDMPLTSGAISGIVETIGRNFGNVVRDSFVLDKDHIFIKISYKGFEELGFINYGVYCIDTLLVSDTDVYPIEPLTRNELEWFPNEIGQQFIVSYFEKFNQFDFENALFEPNVLFEEIAEEQDVPLKDVQEVVLTYLFLMSNY